MRFEVAYRKVESNKKLHEYAEAKLERIEKYELKPSHIKFIFSAKQHMCRTEISVKGPGLYYRATALEDNHLTAIDFAIDKLEKQLARHKSKIQFHKNKDASHEGALARMSPGLEHNFIQTKKGRKGHRAA